MNKIAKVINDCTECQHCVKLASTNNNHTFWAVCDSEKKEPFLIVKTGVKLSHLSVDIPSNCPLEDYKSKAE